MQRVVRSTLVGFLTLAGLTACGDKVTIPPVTTAPVGTVVHSVTVSPNSVTMKAGDKVTLAASVDADAGVTDRTVTWSSSNTAVVTVDANGVVTAVAGGTASVLAASKADPNVKGAAAITVSPNVAATVTISSINQFNGFSSVPANLANVVGQLDVTLNVDPGTQTLAGVDLVMNCATPNNPGTDTVVATQNLSSGDKAPVAEESNAPVTLSFNTASFNSSTGASAFKNGSCVIKAKARTVGGTQTASSTTALTLNNPDVVIGTLTSTKSANDLTGLLWNGGDVTVTAIPVFYTAGRTVASVTLNFEGKTQTLTGTGAKSATFTDGNGANPGGATDIDQITDPAAVAGFQIVDSNGNNFAATCGGNLQGNALCTPQSILVNPNNPVAIGSIRLDTQKPKPGTFLLANNQDQLTSQDGYVGANFKFSADSASGYRGPDAVAGNQTRNLDNAGGTNGVDKVTVVFQTATSRTSTFTSRTDVSGLSETNTSTSLVARMITTDALGNADTSWVNGTACCSSTPAAAQFGVDKTAPTATLTAGPADKATSQTIGGLGNYTFTITDNLSGPSVEPGTSPNPGNVRALVVQTRDWNGLGTSSFDPTVPEGRIYTNTGIAGTFTSTNAEADQSPCIIGRFNASATKAGANNVPAFDRAGNAIGFCTPVPYDLVGGVSVPSDASVATGSPVTAATPNSGVGGYYATQIIFVDQAGNQVKFTSTSGSFTTGVNTVAEDATNPTVSSLDLPGSITGGSTVSIPASASDNLDITGAYAQINYTGSAAMSLRYPTTAGPGVAFDNTLTRSATISPTITSFIKNLQQSASVPASPTTTPAAGDNAQTITECAVDVSNRSGCLAGVPFSPAVSLVNGNSQGTTWSNATFTNGFALTAPGLTPANTIWNCPAPTAGQTTGCGLAGTTVPGATAATLTATAAGTTSTFNNPFTSVSFWYQGTGGVWVQIPNSTVTTASVQDTGVGGQRTWTYTFTWDPPASGPDGFSFMPAPGATIALPVRAIGVNSNGDGLVTQTFTLTISNQ